MWTDVLDEIVSEMAEDNITPQPPTSQDEIQAMLEEVSKLDNVAGLPGAYLQFLMKMNGLNWNGLFIYSSKTMPLAGTSEQISGIVEANEIWRDLDFHKQFLFFGDSDLSLYCQDLKTNEFKELDRSSNTVIKVYDNFESMLADALESSLD